MAAEDTAEVPAADATLDEVGFDAPTDQEPEAAKLGVTIDALSGLGVGECLDTGPGQLDAGVFGRPVGEHWLWSLQ